jgi:6-phospho-beta-glucosidase
MNRRTLAIVGAGAFVPKLCEALAAEPEIPSLDLRLAARRLDRLPAITACAARLVAAHRPDFRVEMSSTLAEAVTGVDAVVLQIRVGGSAARAHDEELPGAFGLVGDEGLGVGGIANAYRTVPVLSGIAALLRERAPDAVVINMMAPLCVTTRLLLDAGLHAAGICELPLVTLEALARSAGVLAADARYRYAGLNHLGWFWEVQAGEVSVLEAAAKAGLVDAEVLARFGAAPLHYYYDLFDREAARRLGCPRKVGRAQELEALSERLVRGFAEGAGGEASMLAERPTPWFERAVVPILRGLWGGRAHDGFIDLRNRGLLADVPEDGVVEVAATVDSAGIHARPAEGVPRPVARFLSAVAEAEELSYRAAVEQSPELLTRAIRALPLPIAEEHLEELTRLACLPIAG